ncbi:unnamed protein product [Pylaiella littoralis]
MISGDSTASHMGSVKNIEKARERRTFEVMPGSSATGLPEEIQEHAQQSVHPRMGYDMSDSLFMQQQEAAGRDKESKRALEEKAALEAFRAAALQKPLDPSAAVAGGAGGEAGAGGGSSGGVVGADRKRKQAPPPLAGIKLRKKTSRSGGSPSSAVSPGGEGVSSPGGRSRSAQKGNGEAKTAGAGGKRSGETSGAGEGEGGSSARKKHKKKKKKESKKGGDGKEKQRASEGGDGGGEDGAAAAAAATVASAGLGLGLVAYSSGEDGDEDS